LELEWWRDIKKVTSEGQNGNWFEEIIEWKLGKGDLINFWNDKWIGEVPLKEKFPRLYANSINKEATIREIGCWNNESWEWNLAWRMELFDWETPQLALMMEQLLDKSLNGEREDIWEWKGENSKYYSDNYAYKILQDNISGDDSDMFCCFWSIKALPFAQHLLGE